MDNEGSAGMSADYGMNNGMITSAQCAKMLFLLALGSSSLVLPTTVTIIARQDSWISMALVAPFNYFFMMIYLALADRFPNMSLAQYAERILGAWLGKLLSLTYILFFTILAAVVLRNITDFLSSSVLLITPTWFIGMSFVIVIIYGLYLGIETIARTGEILFTWVVFVTLILALFLVSQFKFEQFEPLLYAGWARPIKGMFPVLGFPIGEFVMMSMILPFVKQEDRRKLRKSLKLSVVLIGSFSVMICVLLIGVLGVSETMRSPFAVYDMAKNINIKQILVRVEITVAVVWVSTVFMKLIICFYALALLTAQMLNMRSYRPLVFPFGFIVVPLSLIVYRNVPHAVYVLTRIWPMYSLTQGLLIPLALLIIAVVTGKRATGPIPMPAAFEIDTRQKSAGHASSEGERKGQKKEPTTS